MAFKKYQFVGLSAPVYLPDDIPVEIAIVPSSVRNVRSNTPSTAQRSVTYHETANFNAGANADMHKRYLHNGAGGAYVGFNFVVDDHKIIQLTPLNEVTWAAGTPEGNTYSWHVEQCVNSDADLVRARRNTSYLMAGLCAAKGWDPRKAVVQHNVWYGKNCPLVIRRDGLWPTMQNLFVERTNEVKAALSGPTPAPKEEPVDDIYSVLFGPQFNPRGIVSQAWLENGKKTGLYPTLNQMKQIGDKRYFVFSSGWVLVYDSKSGSLTPFTA